MRIHTNLDRNDMYEVLRNSGAPISFENLNRHYSRSHPRAFEVALSGTGGKPMHGDYQGATWDEWGAFFGALYQRDSTARCGGSVKTPGYANTEDFHYKTGDRFQGRWMDLDTFKAHRTFLPADTHPRHYWKAVEDGDTLHFECTQCSATRPPMIPRTYATQES